VNLLYENREPRLIKVVSRN